MVRSHHLWFWLLLLLMDVAWGWGGSVMWVLCWLGVQCSRRCLFSLQLSYAEFQLIVYLLCYWLNTCTYLFIHNGDGTFQNSESLYMKTNIHLWPNVARLFLEWEMFQTKVVEKIEAQFLHSLKFISFFFRKSYRLWSNAEYCGIVRQATDDNINRRVRTACWIS